MSPCKFSGRADPLGLQTYDWIGGSCRPPECIVPSVMQVLVHEELCTPEYSTWNWFAPEYAASEVHSSLLQWHGHIFVDPRRDAQQHFESTAVSRGIATEVRWKAHCNNLTGWPRKHGAEVEWLLSLMISGLFAIALVERNTFEPVYWCDLSWIARRQRTLQDSSQRLMVPLKLQTLAKGSAAPDEVSPLNRSRWILFFRRLVWVG